MPVVFNIPGYLRTFTEGRARVELDVSPASVREALYVLWSVHPGVRDRIVTEHGEVRPHVHVFVGDRSIRSTGGLDTPLPDGAEITILPAVSGG